MHDAAPANATPCNIDNHIGPLAPVFLKEARPLEEQE